MTSAQVFDLAQQFQLGMPQSPNHPQFIHTLPRRHGDMVRPDGGSAANDLISMGTHVGTHIDALAHVSQDGKLYGGVDAQDACLRGKFESHGVHTIPPFWGRGVLIDVARHKGVAWLEGGYEITEADVRACLKETASDIRAGDTVLIRSGWGSLFSNRDAYVGAETGVPGIGPGAAEWIASHRPFAVGADSTALEVVHAGQGHATLPVHRILLVEHGIYIIETLNLEPLSEANVHECELTYAPLNIFGATGSPIRPIAITHDRGSKR